MKLRRTTPELRKIPLDDCATDTAFRFLDATDCAYIRLPYDGSDIYAMYKSQTGSDEQAIEDIVDALAIHNEDLYVFDESKNDQGVVDVDWAEDNLEEFWAFISLTTGVILLAHRNELVVPLDTELIVADKRV